MMILFRRYPCMKFTINTKEFKSVMSLVKTLADSAANARITAHSICLLHANATERQLKLEFSLNGSFLSYTFDDAFIEAEKGDDEEFKRSIDLGSLASLKLSGSNLQIGLGRSSDANTLEFKSGILKGKLILSHPDLEKEIESSRPNENSVELKQQFPVSEFLQALSAHNYGVHHNAQEVAKRPVRIYSKVEGDDARISFVSKDRIVASSFVRKMTTPLTDEFDYYLLPRPLQAVLNALPQTGTPVFDFGMSRDFWRLSHGHISIWFPNIVQEVNFNLDDLVASVASFPSFSLKVAPEHLQKALAEIAPFTSSSHFFTKEDMPIIRLTVVNGEGVFTLNTTKAKDVTVAVDDVEFTAQFDYDPSDVLNLNFKYLHECVTSLCNVTDKKEKEPIFLKWWPYKDVTAPTKGKALCLQRGSNYYWISRVRDQQRSV